MAIEFTFDPPLPEAVFVQLVEDNEGIPSRPLSLADFLPVLPFVPAQIDAGSATLQDLLGKGRLAYLTGTCQEHHFARQVLRDGAVEISLERHAELFLLQGKKVQSAAAPPSWGRQLELRATENPGGAASRPRNETRNENEVLSGNLLSRNFLEGALGQELLHELDLRSA